jgi:hypothetical protein
MGPKGQRYIRTEVRPKLAGAIHHAITELQPLLEKDERSKRWSEIDRFDATDEIDVLMVTVATSADALDRLPDKTRLSRVDKDRYLRAFHGMNGAVGLGRKMTPAEMMRLDAEKAGAGQEWFVAMLRQLMLVLRHALAALFYLVNDARIKTIKLSEKDTNDYRYGGEGVRAAVAANFEHKAREMAVSSGHFTEVIAPDGEVVFDASPHASTVRREMAMTERKAREAYPYVANPRLKDYDVLISLYQHPLLR